MVATNYDVLLVEDSPGDVLLVREAMSAMEFGGELHVVGDGAEALQFLGGEGEFADAPRPDMILLDLNLPVMDGKEALREIKHNPEWKRIPVAILSTSDSDHDIDESYSLSANCYIVKPMDISGYREMVSAIKAFWLSVARLPQKF